MFWETEDSHQNLKYKVTVKKHKVTIPSGYQLENAVDMERFEGAYMRGDRGRRGSKEVWQFYFYLEHTKI